MKGCEREVEKKGIRKMRIKIIMIRKNNNTEKKQYFERAKKRGRMERKEQGKETGVQYSGTLRKFGDKTKNFENF